MKSKLIIAIFVFIIFGIITVFASVNHLHNTIATNYSDGEKISGKINLRFSNEPGDVKVTSNFPGNLTLLELIENQTGLIEGIEYNCSTNGCLNDYSSSGVVQQIQVDSGEVDYAGFKIEGSGIKVKDAKLRISSNAPSSCTPSLYVDLLSDGENILTASKGNGESCGIRHTGCYAQSNILLATIVTGREYCEKISIPQAPGFIVGAQIKQGNGESNLTMKLYDGNTNNLLGSCKLPQHSPQQQTQEISCKINYSSYETREYYVCVSTSINNGYQIGQETISPTCGTAQGFNSLNSDFDIFAETEKYAASPNIVINVSTYKKAFNRNITQIIDQYVQNLYDGNCESDCFVPIKIFGVSQTVLFNEPELKYESFGAVLAPIEEINELDYQSTRITSNNLSLDISKANFVIPIASNENSFKLYLDGNSFLTKPINIRRSFAFDINPKSVAFGQNVRFNATSATIIIRTIWNFGDGTPVQTVNGTSIDHAFTKNGTSFTVNVTAIANNTQVTRTFTVIVGNPKVIANLTIIEYRKRLTNITGQINSYPSWAVPKIQSIVRLNNMTSELNTIELNFRNASLEEEYQNIMLDLIELDVPAYVSSTVSGDNLPLGLGYENINPSYIEEIENKDLQNGGLKEQISAWMNDNFNAEISFKKIQRIGNSGTQPVGGLFTIKTNPINSVNGNVYLIFGQDVENVGVYGTNYKPLSVTSGTDYILLDTSKSETFEFFVEGDIDVETLGAYIAPSLNILGNIETPSGVCEINNICESEETADSCPEDCSRKWFKFTIFGWILIAIGAIIGYIVLQEWYKRNYQRSLFPNSNDLFNLINFIYNARKSGSSDSDIKAKLRQQQWSSERIGFAFKKIEGKRAGMLEIPIFTHKEHNEIVKQIETRQKAPVDARFIKRPYYQ
ncbi:PKD domain-containing protein [Candidatus Pacearchaeota archaeon]|nr:PKD domain-containing protein [Candidatus Pacearchaeota archaeon]